MHQFKLLINGEVAVTKEVGGSYAYAIDYMAGYLQAMKDARDMCGDDDEIEVIYIPPKDFGFAEGMLTDIHLEGVNQS